MYRPHLNLPPAPHFDRKRYRRVPPGRRRALRELLRFRPRGERFRRGDGDRIDVVRSWRRWVSVIVAFGTAVAGAALVGFAPVLPISFGLLVLGVLAFGAAFSVVPETRLIAGILLFWAGLVYLPWIGAAAVAGIWVALFAAFAILRLRHEERAIRELDSVEEPPSAVSEILRRRLEE